MRRNPPQSHRDVLANHRADYEVGVSNGSIIPFIYPISTLAGGVVLLFFLFVSPQSRYHNVFTRYLLYAFIACWHVYYIRYSRGINMTTTFGIGIISAWATVWSAVVLIFDDKKANARRIERVSTSTPLLYKPKEEPSSAKEKSSERRNPPANEQFELSENDGVRRRSHSKRATHDDPSRGTEIPAQQTPTSTYYWQSYPTSLSYTRFEWICDLWTNFRGVGWDFRIAGLPSTPQDVQRQFDSPRELPPDEPTTRTGISRYDDALPLLLHMASLELTGYLLLDLCATLTHHDPYFWGLTTSLPPAYFPHLLHQHPSLTRLYRLLVGMSIIHLALRTLFSLAALIFIPLSHFNILPLGVRAEPWLYPDHYGSYRNVMDRGLAGWWGGWWHQTFRYAFEAAGKWVCGLVGVRQKSMLGKVLMLGTAFGLSGVLHASGSTTQPGETNPWTGPFMFFALQPVGIFVELAARSLTKRTGLADRTPWWLRWVVNFVWVHTWFFVTGPLLVDDMAIGGLWLIEPVMISPLRGMGFGVEGDGWFCWEGTYAKWHRDPGGWWWSGIAL